MTRSSKPISLALHGGGAHGAFTWGVIDQLLLDGRTHVDSISACGGGSVLAAVMAQGLLEGGESAARDHLLTLWKKANLASNLLPLRMNVVDTMLGHVGLDFSAQSLALDTITRLFSPKQFNLFDINPLKGILEEMLDFKALRKHCPFPIHVNATNVRTGKGRVFNTEELSLDVIMASACLPFLFKPVEIDGETYWDGSFSGCPPLSPLVNAGSHDIVLVQVHPSSIEDVPQSAPDILDRAIEISFMAVLNQEIKTIELYNRLVAEEKSGQLPVSLYSISADDTLSSSGRASKLNMDWEFLIYLHDVGVQAATDWLSVHYEQLGKAGRGVISASTAA